MTLHLLIPAFTLALTVAGTKPAHPIHEDMLPALTGPQRGALLTAIKEWPTKLLGANPPESKVSVKLVAYQTPGREHAIGVGQAMLIQAPIAEVRKVMEDFGHYQELFFQFKDIHVEERDGNRVVIAWEQPIPLPFVPNTKYSTYFYIDGKDPARVFYRYQLKTSNTLKYSDGLIVLDRIDSQTTRYTEYDFFDADWGLAASLAPARIWRDALRDIYYTDVAIKLKAEHPDWSYDKIRGEAKKHWSDEYNDDSIGDILKDKKIF